MIPVVISGGSGTRLWPLSRSQFPKQFCNLFGESLQTLTLRRLASLGRPWIVTSQALRGLTEIQLKAAGQQADLLCEPEGRNTAAALALVCRVFAMKGLQNQVVGLFPADHLVTDEKAFLSAVQLAESLARQNRIVTLGIQPTHPETGFGYIQTTGDDVAQQSGLHAKAVSRFHEKPNLSTAEKFLSEGGYSWNAGIFIFRVDRMSELFAHHAPEVWQPLGELREDLSNLATLYSRVKSISIDYAIMEKLGGTGELVCIPVEMGWSDVGSWDAVAEQKRGTQDTTETAVLEIEARDNFVWTHGQKQVCLIGVKDLRVVDTGDTLLIAQKGHTQRVKDAVEVLQKQGSPLVREHGFEDRPWGHFEVLRDEVHFKSKVIRVSPRAQISYQSHAQREEHWIIVRGVGEVVLNDVVTPVSKGSYVHIPLQAKHRIRNTSDDPLEFVEVQLGESFSESDIVRHQDDYKRV